MPLINGVWQFGGVGNKNTGNNKRFSEKAPGWFATEFNKVMAIALSQSPGQFTDDIYPVYSQKIQWYTFYNTQTKPSLADHRNPNWSGWRWNNGGGTGTTGGWLNDPFTEALNSSLIQNGNGVAKFIPTIGLGASGEQFGPPTWMRSAPYGWLDTTGGANGSAGEYHINYQNAEVRDHVVAFFEAFLAKYGNNRGLHSVCITEYFLGNNQDFVSGVSATPYYNAVADTWERIKNAAPVSGGGRVNIMQINPVTYIDGVDVSTVSDAGFGISTADAELGFGTNTPDEVELMLEMSAANSGHLMPQNDGRLASQGRTQNWAQAPSNPWGYGANTSKVATLQELFWYYSRYVGAHSFLCATGTNQPASDLLDAIATFGRHATQARPWGDCPAPITLLGTPVNGGGTETGATTGSPVAIGTLVSGVQLQASPGSLSDPDNLNPSIEYDWAFSDPARNWTGPTYLLRSSQHPGLTFTLTARGFDAQGNPFSLTSGTYGPVKSVIISPVADYQVSEGDELQLMLESMGDAASFAYSVSGLPESAQLNSSTGALTWTPTVGDAGVYTATFSVDDSIGTDSTQAQFTVLETVTTYPFYTVQPNIKSTSATGHTIQCAISQDGRVWGIRLPVGSNPPSADQVRLGNDSNGSQALESVDQGTLSQTLVDLPFTTAEKDTQYDYYLSIGNDLNPINYNPSTSFIRALTSLGETTSVSNINGHDDCGVFETRKLIEHAFRRCKILPQRISPENLETALDLLHMYLSTLQNTGVTLWTIERMIIPIYPGQSATALHEGVIDLLECNLQTAHRIIGSQISTTEGFGVNAFDGDITSACTHSQSGGSITMILSMESKATSWGLLPNVSGIWDFTIEISNDGINYETVALYNDFEVVQNQWEWFDISTSPSTYYKLRAINTTKLDVREIVYQKNPKEVALTSLSRDLYNNITNKSSDGRPTQYWYDKQEKTPIVHLWPAASDQFTFSQLICYVHSSVQENRSLPDKLTIPARWQLAIISVLSAELAREIPEVDSSLFAELDAEAEFFERDARGSESDGVTASFLPSISPYTM